MNVTETLNKAKDLLSQVKECNLDVLDFFYQILLKEAIEIDSTPNHMLSTIANDLQLVMDHLMSRSIGKKNIFASKIIIQAYNKMKDHTNEIKLNLYILVLSFQDSEEIIREREYILSDKGREDFLDLWK